MLKKITLAFVLLTGLTGALYAQVATNFKVLEDATNGYKLKNQTNYNRALSLAKQKNWPLVITAANGARGVLVGMDAFDLPKYYISNNNITAAATTRADQLWPGGITGLNLSGNSANMKNKLAIWDGGKPLDTHVELVGRVTWKDPNAGVSYDDHATHVTGTMIASGVNPLAKGMAFGLQGIIAYDYNNDISEISGEAANLLLSNHSYAIIAGWNYNTTQSRWEFYGRANDNEDYKFGYYSDDAQALDSIAYNAPFYLIVKAAGNNRTQNGPPVGQPYYRLNASNVMAAAGNRPAGISNNDSYGTISWDGNAKNILTVGAVQGIPGGYNRPEDVVGANFSSWGPTDDGRIKPDVVADGINVLSSVATGNNAYASFSGTSMASPNTTGSLLLLQEYFSKLKSGSFMRSATLKGLAIHTADEAGTAPGPDYQNGWGLLNVQKAAAVMTAAIPSNNAATSAHLLYENTLNNGASFTTTVVASGKGPLIATICWTDVKGNVDESNVLNNSAKKLVNDLDIRITSGTKTFLPWTLNPSSPSSAALPGDNTLDNVERIDVDTTIPGQTYTITVSHKGTLVKNQQAYSLLVSGVGGTTYCTSAPTSSAGGRIDSVSFQTIHFSNPAGPTTYTNNTNLVADIEPSQTVPFFAKISSSDGTTANKIAKVFIDFDNSGTFETSELVATSAVITSGNLSTTISIPSGLTIGNYLLMRIILQETSNASDVTACGSYTKGETQDYRLHVISPSNDFLVSEITAPTANSCASGSQYVTINIKNNGTLSQTNVPVTVTIKSGSTTVATLTGIYPGTIPALTAVLYTLQTPVTLAAATTYTITATVTVSNDQNVANNSITATLTTAANPPAITAVGELCTPVIFLQVNNPNVSSNYFWYTSPTSAPFTSGSTVSTTLTTTGNTYYVGAEYSGNFGLANKMVYANGGYNSFAGNFMKFNNSVPVVIESAKLYIGNPGKIKFTIGNLVKVNADGSFSYSILSTTTIDAYATNPNPAPAPADGSTTVGNPAADTGAVFYLNLPVTTTGDHIFLTECLTGGTSTATIFRNNGITGNNTYPIGIPNVISFTGNSNSVVGANESPVYYFYYNVKVNTGACMSDRVPVVATAAPTPVITQVGDSLASNIAAGNQWYLNGSPIGGTHTTDQKFKPTVSGAYTSVVTDGFGCQKISNVINYIVTAIPPEVLAQEIKLNVSPNPNNGLFNLSFEVTTKSDLTIDIFNSSGQKVYNRSYPGFSGKFAKQLQMNGGTGSGVYILKIQHNKKTYLQKIIVE